MNKKAMDFFAIGQIVKTRGLIGCLKVISYAQTQNIFAGLKDIYIEKTAGQKNKYNIRKIDITGKFLFIELEEISNVELARHLVGGTIFLPKDMLPKLPEGEYYWQDIIGLNVVGEGGESLGKVESIFPTGSNDVYVCKGSHSEILLPATAEVIKKIDIQRHFMKVKLPKGLL
ncbi:MAG: 16S rRNA processing protein RimM [Deltaproteobacteria bacterium RBG_19FT_COMBO_43_11]|nr:MAG: 16S rRNA processing protein RimM [Deltaproteobacteria bacterium RBG_19FT_COMBO_43_11]